MATIGDYEKTISGCNYKIKELEDIKQTIKDLIPSLESCDEIVMKFSTYAKEIIINNKPLDEDKMIDVADSIDTIKDNLNQIINECNEKIKSYQEKIIQCKDAIISNINDAIIK